jgi:hypothetical protein
MSVLDADRLMIITCYADNVTHASEETCYQRNRLMMELADEIVIGYAAPGGNLERLCGECHRKKIDFFINTPCHNTPNTP